MLRLWIPLTEKTEKKTVFAPYCGDETITSYDRAYKKRPRTFFGLFFVHYKVLEGDNRLGMCIFGFTAHRKRTATQKRRAGKWKSDGVVGGACCSSVPSSL